MYNNAFNNLTSLYNNPVCSAGYGFGYSQQTKQEITEVYGVQGAQAYQMAPNSSVILLDASEPIVYIKKTDGAGSASIVSYNLVQRETEQAKTNELEMRIKRLEEIINESNTFSIKSAESEKSAQSD